MKDVGMKERRQKLLALPTTCLGWIAILGTIVMSIVSCFSA
jgi:hypothetical protein